jgi:hypothetical protein
MRASGLIALSVSLLALTSGRAEIVKGVLGITGAEMK